MVCSPLNKSIAFLLVIIAVAAAPASALPPAYAARPLRPAAWNAPASVDKYAPLLLSMLPRSTVTPSGPSGGTNGAGN
uniref:Uncharacterized protein n=1 Tax=Oryza brachyantha TaxID=4533 RepID=J3M611_ORYBR